MRKDNDKYFEERKVDALIKFSFKAHSVDVLRGISFDLRDVYESYAAGVSRAHQLGKHSTWLAVQCIAFGQIVARATYEETGQWEYSRKIKNKTEDVLLRTMRIQETPQSISRQTLQRKLYASLKSALDRAPSDLVETFDSLLPSLVVLSYAAFESLCEDLLDKAIEMRPKWLAGLHGRKAPRRYPIWEQLRPRGKMQTLGKNNGPVSYRSLSAIRDSYWTAFFKDAKQIDTVLKCRELDTLYAIRNVIVHTGGRIDPMFINRVHGLPAFSKSVEGKPLQMDFEMVCNAAKVTFIKGIRLIAAVSKWMDDHPDSKAP